MQAIILAGGKGTRLKPYTTFLPKPLVPIGDVPIIEIVLRQLKYFGFSDIILAVNHLAELIVALLGDGEKYGLRIRYSREEEVLGTAGPLGLIDELEENFIVMNGDLLTTLNYRNFFKEHVNSENDVTICTANKKIKIDLGVLKTTGNKFIEYIEKPTYNFQVSSGIYAMRRSSIKDIEKGKYLDMPDFIRQLQKSGKSISCYNKPFYWLDIGRTQDYETAVDTFLKRKEEFLPHG